MTGSSAEELLGTGLDMLDAGYNSMEQVEAMRALVDSGKTRQGRNFVGTGPWAFHQQADCRDHGGEAGARSTPGEGCRFWARIGLRQAKTQSQNYAAA